MIKAKHQLLYNREFLENLPASALTSTKDWKDAGLSPEELCRQSRNPPPGERSDYSEAFLCAYPEGEFMEISGDNYSPDAHISALNDVEQERYAGVPEPTDELKLCYNLWRLSNISQMERGFFSMNLPVDDLEGVELK